MFLYNIIKICIVWCYTVNVNLQIILHFLFFILYYLYQKYSLNTKKSSMTLQTSLPDVHKFSVYRSKSSKIVFTLATLIFFMNYFFVGAGFFDDFLIQFIPYTYTIFVVSFIIFGYYLFMDMFSWKLKIIGFFLFIIFTTILFWFLMPIIFKENILQGIL